jgi:hypothetical protein
MFENRVLRRIFGPTEDEIIGGWRKCIMMGFITYILSPNIFRMIKSRMRLDRTCIMHEG